MSDCLFCKIIAGQIPSNIVYRDDTVVAFKDINPQAPLHVLIVPTKHVASLNELSPEDDGLVGSLVRRAAALAKQSGYHERGYRTVLNTNREAGQTVFHIHLHLLAGRPLGWPPG
jgi:histidine triad (HIT) family protein